MRSFSAPARRLAPHRPLALAAPTASAAAPAPAGAVAFELLARRQLLPVGSNLAEYESRVHSLPLMDMAGEAACAPRCMGP